MTVTRTTLMVNALKRIGAQTGTFASGSTASIGILTGLVNQTGDDSTFANCLLIMPDASAEADKAAVIDVWEDRTGKAHISTRSVSIASGSTYILMPRDSYTLKEVRDALNAALVETSRTYRYAIPLAANQRVIPLTPLTWLNGAGNIDAAWLSDNPNLIHNGDFGLWQNGPALAPDSWTLAGASAAVARASGGTHSPYGATLTRSGADASLTQSIPAAMVQYLLRSSNASLPTLAVVALVSTSTASIARVGIGNGSSTTYSSYHTGSSVPAFLSTTYASTATDTDLNVKLSVDTTDGNATFLFAALVVGSSVPTALRDDGDSAYREHEAAYVQRNIGGVPAIELLSTSPDLQLVTYTRRAFPEMDDDSDTVDDEYARAVQAGLVVKLLQNRKPNQDRTRLDVIMREEQSIWNRLTANFNSLPVPKPPAMYVISGA